MDERPLGSKPRLSAIETLPELNAAVHLGCELLDLEFYRVTAEEPGVVRIYVKGRAGGIERLQTALRRIVPGLWSVAVFSE